MQNDPLPTQMKLYNPLLRDFEVVWLDEKDKEHTIVLRSMEITTLPYSQGEFMKKHLIDAIVIERGIKHSWDEDAKDLEKEVTV